MNHASLNSRKVTEMTNDYNQNKAIAALLRGETIPSAWMDELSKVKTLSLDGNQITDPSGLAALTGTLRNTRIIK